MPRPKRQRKGILKIEAEDEEENSNMDFLTPKSKRRTLRSTAAKATKNTVSDAESQDTLLEGEEAQGKASDGALTSSEFNSPVHSPRRGRASTARASKKSVILKQGKTQHEKIDRNPVLEEESSLDPPSRRGRSSKNNTLLDKDQLFKEDEVPVDKIGTALTQEESKLSVSPPRRGRAPKSLSSKEGASKDKTDTLTQDSLQTPRGRSLRKKALINYATVVIQESQACEEPEAEIPISESTPSKSTKDSKRRGLRGNAISPHSRIDLSYDSEDSIDQKLVLEESTEMESLKLDSDEEADNSQLENIESAEMESLKCDSYEETDNSRLDREESKDDCIDLQSSEKELNDFGLGRDIPKIQINEEQEHSITSQEPNLDHIIKNTIELSTKEEDSTFVKINSKDETLSESLEFSSLKNSDALIEKSLSDGKTKDTSTQIGTSAQQATVSQYLKNGSTVASKRKADYLSAIQDVKGDSSISLKHESILLAPSDSHIVASLSEKQTTRDSLVTDLRIKPPIKSNKKHPLITPPQSIVDAESHKPKQPQITVSHTKALVKPKKRHPLIMAPEKEKESSKKKKGKSPKTKSAPSQMSSDNNFVVVDEVSSPSKEAPNISSASSSDLLESQSANDIMGREFIISVKVPKFSAYKSKKKMLLNWYECLLCTETEMGPSEVLQHVKTMLHLLAVLKIESSSLITRYEKKFSTPEHLLQIMKKLKMPKPDKKILECNHTSYAISKLRILSQIYDLRLKNVQPNLPIIPIVEPVSHKPVGSKSFDKLKILLIGDLRLRKLTWNSPNLMKSVLPNATLDTIEVYMENKNLLSESFDLLIFVTLLHDLVNVDIGKRTLLINRNVDVNNIVTRMRSLNEKWRKVNPSMFILWTLPQSPDFDRLSSSDANSTGSLKTSPEICWFTNKIDVLTELLKNYPNINYLKLMDLSFLKGEEIISRINGNIPKKESTIDGIIPSKRINKEFIIKIRDILIAKNIVPSSAIVKETTNESTCYLPSTLVPASFYSEIEKPEVTSFMTDKILAGFEFFSYQMLSILTYDTLHPYYLARKMAMCSRYEVVPELCLSEEEFELLLTDSSSFKVENQMLTYNSKPVIPSLRMESVCMLFFNTFGIIKSRIFLQILKQEYFFFENCMKTVYLNVLCTNKLASYYQNFEIHSNKVKDVFTHWMTSIQKKTVCFERFTSPPLSSPTSSTSTMQQSKWKVKKDLIEYLFQDFTLVIGDETASFLKELAQSKGTHFSCSPKASLQNVITMAKDKFTPSIKEVVIFGGLHNLISREPSKLMEGPLRLSHNLHTCISEMKTLMQLFMEYLRSRDFHGNLIWVTPPPMNFFNANYHHPSNSKDSPAFENEMHKLSSILVLFMKAFNDSVSSIPGITLLPLTKIVYGELSWREMKKQFPLGILNNVLINGVIPSKKYLESFLLELNKRVNREKNSNLIGSLSHESSSSKEPALGQAGKERPSSEQPALVQAGKEQPSKQSAMPRAGKEQPSSKQPVLAQTIQQGGFMNSEKDLIDDNNKRQAVFSVAGAVSAFKDKEQVGVPKIQPVEDAKDAPNIQVEDKLVVIFVGKVAAYSNIDIPKEIDAEFINFNCSKINAKDAVLFNYKKETKSKRILWIVSLDVALIGRTYQIHPSCKTYSCKKPIDGIALKNTETGNLFSKLNNCDMLRELNDSLLSFAKRMRELSGPLSYIVFTPFYPSSLLAIPENSKPDTEEGHNICHQASIEHPSTRFLMGSNVSWQDCFSILWSKYFITLSKVFHSQSLDFEHYKSMYEKYPLKVSTSLDELTQVDQIQSEWGKSLSMLVTQLSEGSHATTLKNLKEIPQMVAEVCSQADTHKEVEQDEYEIQLVYEHPVNSIKDSADGKPSFSSTIIYVGKKVTHSSFNIPINADAEYISFNTSNLNEKDASAVMNKKQTSNTSLVWVIIVDITLLCKSFTIQPHCARFVCERTVGGQVLKNSKDGSPRCIAMSTCTMVEDRNSRLLNFVRQLRRLSGSNSQVVISPLYPTYLFALDPKHDPYTKEGHEEYHKAFSKEPSCLMLMESKAKWHQCFIIFRSIFTQTIEKIFKLQSLNFDRLKALYSHSTLKYTSFFSPPQNMNKDLFLWGNDLKTIVSYVLNVEANKKISESTVQEKTMEDNYPKKSTLPKVKTLDEKYIDLEEELHLEYAMYEDVPQLHKDFHIKLKEFSSENKGNLNVDQFRAYWKNFLQHSRAPHSQKLKMELRASHQKDVSNARRSDKSKNLPLSINLAPNITCKEAKVLEKMPSVLNDLESILPKLGKEGAICKLVLKAFDELGGLSQIGFKFLCQRENLRRIENTYEILIDKSNEMDRAHQIDSAFSSDLKNLLKLLKNAVQNSRIDSEAIAHATLGREYGFIREFIRAASTIEGINPSLAIIDQISSSVNCFHFFLR